MVVDGLEYVVRYTVRYAGEFLLRWLQDDEQVSSAGDGSGAAIVTSPRGERRIDVGDEFEVIR